MNAKPKWNPGNTLVFGQTREEYDLLKREHWSTLKHMAKSPAHYRHGQTQWGGDTPSMKLGRAVHSAVLEPERFKVDWVKWDGGRRVGKEWEAFCAAHSGREILTETEHAQCLVLQDVVRSDAVAASYLAAGESEVAVLWTHEEPDVGGVPGFRVDMKGRLDFLGPSAIVDLKTCRDGSISGFDADSYRHRYHTQAAFYRDGHYAASRLLLPYVLISVEVSGPYAVTVRPVPERLLALGREEYRALLQRLDICRREAKWPSYADAPVELGLPGWADFEREDEDLTGIGLEVSAAGEA